MRPLERLFSVLLGHIQVSATLRPHLCICLWLEELQVYNLEPQQGPAAVGPRTQRHSSFQTLNSPLPQPQQRTPFASSLSDRSSQKRTFQTASLPPHTLHCCRLGACTAGLCCWGWHCSPCSVLGPGPTLFPSLLCISPDSPLSRFCSFPLVARFLCLVSATPPMHLSPPQPGFTLSFQGNRPCLPCCSLGRPASHGCVPPAPGRLCPPCLPLAALHASSQCSHSEPS